MTDKPDIRIRLALAAAEAGTEELRTLLLEAAEDIETLRILVGIREEVELEYAEPEGNALGRP